MDTLTELFAHFLTIFFVLLQRVPVARISLPLFLPNRELGFLTHSPAAVPPASHQGY